MTIAYFIILADNELMCTYLECGVFQLHFLELFLGLFQIGKRPILLRGVDGFESRDVMVANVTLGGLLIAIGATKWKGGKPN